MDKIAHSAFGLGMYTAFLITFNFYILLGLIFIAIGKECFDYIRYGGFDTEDIKATMNPLLVIKWYWEQIK